MSNEQIVIDILQEGSVAIIYVRGDLTLLDAPQFKKIVDDEVNKGIKKLLFDFENLTFLDSSGIGLLLRFHAQLRKLNGKIAYINFHKNVENTMQKALPQQIRSTSFFESKEKAMEYMNS
ncbi:MAG TPA: STAS domain-containing protein [Leptospiraceae bacterium]|nr:STAS domain-containing protein [Leptospiraceae bacterium]HMW08687.1 STAS domain-containing protein [Leptospiraceae bacterium]HMY32356.1 STAS domain-containing protein [Leptospiraceae bacterium]HMZ62442.1 STAS domain-containing protein [Leptospiraceae bacterium]HNA05674.1 STAS domain-containing protein [Leptospiraceae bacterium]